MSEFKSRRKLDGIATVVAAPRTLAETEGAIVGTTADRSFQLPPALYVVTVSAYLGFIGIMAATFLGSELVLPMVIFVLIIVAGFGTPMLWVRMRPDNDQRAMTLSSFKRSGIQIQTGHLAASSAAVQVLILPLLILCWGVAVAVIAALT